MATYKARFIFFKSFTCGHCNVFFDSGVWQNLEKDSDLKKAGVALEIVEFGLNKKTGVVTKLDPVYSFVTYAPYFYLEAPGRNAAGGVSGAEFKGSRGYEDLKAFVFKNLKENSIFSAAASPAPAASASSAGGRKLVPMQVASVSRPIASKPPAQPVPASQSAASSAPAARTASSASSAAAAASAADYADDDEEGSAPAAAPKYRFKVGTGRVKTL